MKIKVDCIHFRGDKPCGFQTVCIRCSHYEPFPTKILVIKCRAQGDVLRTTAILPGLKREYPRSFIGWVVDGESAELLAGNPFIDRIYPFDLESILSLFVEKYDILISLDKEPGPTALATRVACPRKLGFGRNEHGSLIIFNKAAEYACRLGVDDRLKFHLNRKTYQDVIHEVAEIPFRRDEYVFVLREEDRENARLFFTKHRVPAGRPAVGLNTGAGTKFQTKQWPREGFLKLISLLKDKLGANVFLLGGPRERESNADLALQSRRKVFNTGNDNTLREFAGFLSMMDVVVSSDTLAMHLAVALKKKVVALFGPTCAKEIDLYERGEKLEAGVKCAPCYKQTCSDMTCMKAIPAKRVFEAIKTLL